MRGGGICTACRLVDTRGMNMFAGDACSGLPSRMFCDEIEARKFMNRECDCR